MSTLHSVDALPLGELLAGDVRDVLPTLPASSVDCIITSPPYYRLRNYGADWQIGLEDSVSAWVDELRLVLRGLARVIKPTGSLWLNLGDSFAAREHEGALPKSLLLAPERVALAMTQDGWMIRSKVIWAKTNPMPTSVRDRLSTTYEVIYFATRSRQYYFDLDAIRVPHRSTVKDASATAARRAVAAKKPEWAGPLAGSNSGLDGLKARGLVGHSLGKNPGDVWTLPTSRSGHGHHATFPVDLITRPLLASCPERVCAACDAPWQRQPPDRRGHLAVIGKLAATCACNAPARPGIVLDPFMGSGTVAVAAKAHGRDWLGIELNGSYVQQATERIAAARRVRDEAVEVSRPRGASA